MIPSKCETTAKPTRNLRVNNIQQFQFLLKRYSAFEQKQYYNLYYSLATFKDGVPYQDLTDLSTDARNNEEWNKRSYREMVAYDFCLDIDAGSHDDIEYCVQSLILIRDFLDLMDCPYYVRFSGMGFHVVIPYEFIPASFSFDPKEKNNIYKAYTKVAKYMYDNFSEMVDYEIFDARRVIKLPYSLSIYDNGVYYCKPITDIDNFNMGSVRAEGEISKEVLFNPNGNAYKLLKEVGIEW